MHNGLPAEGLARERDDGAPAAPDSIDLWWLPLGAGDHVVWRFGRLYEAMVAARDRRERRDLYHAALEIRVAGQQYVIESAPAWDHPAPDRGVVAAGPVGLSWLGRWELFRYEVRRWPDGRIPDAASAVESPQRVSSHGTMAQRLHDAAPDFPTMTWGRDEQGLGDMWNSNSLIAWLLTVSGHDVESIGPPPHGRAPGWAAGVAAARRSAPVLGA